jgi:hypothetical protein
MFLAFFAGSNPISSYLIVYTNKWTVNCNPAGLGPSQSPASAADAGPRLIFAKERTATVMAGEL